ncbi:MAG: transglutaminase-like domain-containing protein [Peptococcaceae bacterium]|nr:transglutaminase-like domain-containing protein [Peptococcaceae bacterium]
MKIRPMLIMLQSVFLILSGGCLTNSSAAAPAPTVLRDFPPDLLLLPQESDVTEKAENAGIDYGNADQGYIMAWYSGPKNAKIQIVKTDDGEGQSQQWSYDVDQTGVKEVLPLQEGSGSYRIVVAEQIEGTRYSPLVSVEFDVAIADDLLPFLYPNKYVMYSPESFLTQKAWELTRGCTSDIEALNEIYVFVKEFIKYDSTKAETIENFYTPDPDAVLADGKGICMDYASLVCAMLRANHIPAKMITGKVEDNLNHAWNAIYLENEGWVDVRLYLEANHWELIDLTFAAGNISSEKLAKYIGGGEKYTALKVY